ncbi:MAG: 4-(cytidine 5'-diphospho)-2-C-methyl-D-erythritol kinase [Gemmatimonadota bacterium]
MSGAAVGRRSLEAHAKLNLRLRVLAREESGYHGIETLFLRLELADRVEVEPGPRGILLELEGDERVPAGPANLCVRAARALFDAAGVEPAVRIRLEKRIPAEAGLGGGSADAAAVLAALGGWPELAALAGPLPAVAARVGSDVPFGLSPKPLALAWERGRRLLPLDPPPSRPVLVAVPPFGIATADAYRWLADDRSGDLTADAGAEEGIVLPEPAELRRWETLERLARNDLERPVFRRHPELARLRDALRASGARPALLCGSGSSVAGMFREEGERDEAARRLERDAGVRAIRTRTIGPVAG